MKHKRKYSNEEKLATGNVGDYCYHDVAGHLTVYTLGHAKTNDIIIFIRYCTLNRC